MSSALARQFIAALRAHGHGPYVQHGHFGFQLSVRTPIQPPEPHPGGFSYPFGFDTDPYADLLRDPNRRGELIEATREAEAFSAHVAGTDQ